MGKTELTLCFSDYLLGAGSVRRFDMSEYQNQNAVGLLLGEHLGERGLLGAALDRCAAATLLFDEIEKGAPARARPVFADARRRARDAWRTAARST